MQGLISLPPFMWPDLCPSLQPVVPGARSRRLLLRCFVCLVDGECIPVRTGTRVANTCTDDRHTSTEELQDTLAFKARLGTRAASSCRAGVGFRLQGLGVGFRLQGVGVGFRLQGLGVGMEERPQAVSVLWGVGFGLRGLGKGPRRYRYYGV